MATATYTIQRLRPRRDGGGLLPLGPREEILSIFAAMNTAPDHDGGEVLFGPGMRVALVVDEPRSEVQSIDLRVVEPELFELMFEGTAAERPGRLARAVRQRGWTLVNLETGMAYPPIRTDDDDDEADDAGARDEERGG